MIGAALRALIIVAGVAAATPVLAHASLVSSYPPDSILLPAAPGTIALTFNEPVSIIELQLTDANGRRQGLPDAHVEGNSIVASLPAGLANGTDALSWRVVSVDGHPIGATLVFSIGTVTASGAAPERPAPPGLYPMIWLSGLMLFAGQFVGVGGGFFARWIVPEGALPPGAHRVIVAILVVGMVGGLLSLGLEGVDVLGEGLAGLVDPPAWAAAFGTSYAGTVALSEIAFVTALVALLLVAAPVGRILSGVAIVATGLALTLSGHVQDTPLQTATWAAVLLHTTSAAFWVGSLVPLAMLLRKPGAPATRVALLRFSRAIPFAIVPLVFAGLLLTVVQFDSPADFWTTDYGRILALKLAAVLALFALAVANRFVFTDRVARGNAGGGRALRRSIAAEIGLAVVVLALVELWRFTPPPRTVAAVTAALAAPAMTHVMAPPTMADVTVTPGRAGPVAVSLNLTNIELLPVDAKEVSVDLTNPDAGILTISRPAVRAADGSWHVDGLILPVAGIWRITVNALITDFEQASMEGSLVIRR